MSKLYVDEIIPKTSGNQVLMPNKPAFMADMRGQGTVTGTGVLPFVNARLDNNNNYDTTNKKFTAPVTGTYFFNYGFLVRNSVVSAHIYVNGSATASARTGYCDAIPSSGSGLEIMISGSEILSLNSGDYVQIYVSYLVGQDIYAEDINYFNGYLIG